MLWRILNKSTGASEGLSGTFDEAVCQAQSLCTNGAQRFSIWLRPADLWMADVGEAGCVRARDGLSGEDVQRLMRRFHKTIDQLSFIMGIAKKRIRHVREHGLQGPAAVQDWLQAISGEDPGPLPERYYVRHLTEEGACCYCGGPIYHGEYAWEYVGGMFCSVTCCRKSRGWGLDLP